jgi:hypothetical protein
MSLEKLKNLLPTPLSGTILVGTIGLSIAVFPLVGRLQPEILTNIPILLPLPELISAETILLLCTLLSLILVVRHCHEQKLKIESLERELKGEQAINMIDRFKDARDSL